MGKIKTILCTLTLLCGVVGGVNSAYATKLYATYGTPAGEGRWNAETGVYNWTASTSNLMDLFTFGNGELKDYVSLQLSTSDYVDGPYRVCFMNGSNVAATIAFYSAGDKDLVFANREETKNLDLSTITSIKFGGASNSGSVKISQKPYLVKPMSLVFGDDGFAEISLSDMTASGGFSLNDQTGELTGTGEYGSLSINFPTEGVDLSALTGFSVTYTGDNLFNNFEIGNGTTNKGFWSSVTGRNDLNQYMTVENVGNPTAITRWRWYNNSTASAMTISSIKLQANVITASNPHETPLTTAMYTGNPESHFGETMGQGATIYGMGANIDGAQYVDLSAYDEMHIYGTPGKSIRLLFNYEQSEPIKTDVYDNLDGNGYYSLDLSTLSAQKLNAFKFPWDGASGVITKIILYKNNVPVEYSYVISGKGSFSTSVITALADVNATSYDATNVTGTGVELVSANPNTMFLANEGALANTSNVIVNGTCANLVLTDGYAFKAPADFTATSATYNTTINAEAEAGTLCLPFAAAIPDGVEAYTLTYTSGDKSTATPVETTIPANTPVLLNGSGEKTFTGSGAVVADASNVYGALTGVFAQAYVPQNSYVLQYQDPEVGFFQVAEANSIQINPFRAYLTAEGAGARLAIEFTDEVTGIEEIASANAEGRAFNLAGQRVTNPTKGLYIQNGKKVLVK